MNCLAAATFSIVKLDPCTSSPFSSTARSSIFSLFKSLSLSLSLSLSMCRISSRSLLSLSREEYVSSAFSLYNCETLNLLYLLPQRGVERRRSKRTSKPLLLSSLSALAYPNCLFNSLITCITVYVKLPTPSVIWMSRWQMSLFSLTWQVLSGFLFFNIVQWS